VVAQAGGGMYVDDYVLFFGTPPRPRRMTGSPAAG
jgi:hypothetical protein